MGRPEKDDDRSSEGGDAKPPEARSRSAKLLEAGAAAVSGILVAGVIGLIAWQALTAPAERVPHLTVGVERVERQASGYHVAFRAINSGSGTAAAVRLEGRLSEGAETIEVRTATLDYVPSHSDQRGGLFFQHDPRGLDLRLTVTGYQEP